MAKSTWGAGGLPGTARRARCGSSIQGSGLPLPALIMVTMKGDFIASAKLLIFEMLQKSSPGLTGEAPAGLSWFQLG